jgi:hypothetical protein
MRVALKHRHAFGRKGMEVGAARGKELVHEVARNDTDSER